MENDMRKRKVMLTVLGVVMACSLLGGCQSSNSEKNNGSGTAVSSEAETGSDADTGLSSKKEYSRDIFAMDTYMTLTAYGKNAQKAVDDGVEEIQRLDALLSTGNENSEIAQINKNHGGEMSEETAYMVERALDIYRSTGGAFDISIYPVMQLWGFTTGNFAVPSDTDLAAKLALVDAGKISIEKNTDGKSVISMPEGMEIDLGGIAKGYTSGLVMEIFKEYGVKSAVINLGGNAQVLGSKTDGSAWKVGIQDPEDENGYLGGLSVTDEAVITSGGYERNFTDEATGITYHHIIDPKTGYSANNGLISVTIVSSDSTLADGLSTSLFVLGTDKAIAYAKEHCQEDNFGVLMETEDHKIYITDNLKDQFIDINGNTELNVIETK